MLMSIVNEVHSCVEGQVWKLRRKATEISQTLYGEKD